MVAIGQPQAEPGSQTPASHAAALAAMPPPPSGEPVPITVASGAESAASNAPVLPGATVEPAQPGGGFGVTADSLKDKPLPTTADTAAHPEASAAMEGEAALNQPATVTPPVETAATTTPPVSAPAGEISTPLSEPGVTPSPVAPPSFPMAVGPEGTPTGSQVLGENDKVIVSKSETSEAEEKEYAEWVVRARDGLTTILQREKAGESLSSDDLKRKRLFVAVLNLDVNQN